MATSRRSITFILGSLAMTIASLTAVALLNWKVDPFQQYRLAPVDQVRYPRALQRYINPGLAKNADYNFVITGSSLMENYDLAEVNRLCAAKSINLATSAISGYEQRKILEVALRHRAPTRVVMTLDFNSFAPPIESSLPEITDPLPLYLYDQNPLNDFRYLISGQVMMRTLSILHGVRIGNYSTNSNRAWSWDEEVTFSRDRALKDIDPANINRRFKQGARTVARMHASFDRNIATLIEQYPGTEFNLVFPPYSIVVWADFIQRGQFDVSLEFKRYVLQRVAAYPNARVFDLQWDRDIVENLDLYTDIYHFNPAINRKMLGAVCNNDAGYRVNDKNIDEFETILRKQAPQVDIQKLLQSSQAPRQVPVTSKG
jgi:hypothetical protein